jgi:tetratricopeptide (TPR) repeat protein
MPALLSLASVRSKVELLEETVKRAPDFAEAWGRLGYARANLAFLLPEDACEALHELSRSEARRALELDPRCAAAAVAMARSTPMFGAFRVQSEWLARASEWAPNDSFVMRFSAIFAASVGRCGEAATVLRRAVSLDPLSFAAFNSFGSALRENGELDEAEAVFVEAVARWPEFSAGAVGLAFTLGFKGEFDRARQLMEAHDLGPHRGGITWFLEVLEDRSQAAGSRAIGALRRSFEKTGRIGLDMMMMAGRFGRADEALDIALRADFGPAPQTPDPRGTDAYNPPVLFMAPLPEIRRDPRFVAVCARLGLVDYWLATDAWPDCADDGSLPYDFRAECRRAAAR